MDSANGDSDVQRVLSARKTLKCVLCCTYSRTTAGVHTIFGFVCIVYASNRINRINKLFLSFLFVNVIKLDN